MLSIVCGNVPVVPSEAAIATDPNTGISVLRGSVLASAKGAVPKANDAAADGLDEGCASVDVQHFYAYAV
ncbi:hypothetical protein LPH50_10185 [Xylella taiwanensis]|nr:hypothetical protein [Xylella taiwanensis]MCD8456297.1 hypothetical protein [Xylella taiwanensis]MCD8458706.1 hypothetical protein [Xylella taiwanensis]MCD8460841.1 hypothetical protein [Xylella taiwanensis]MCD8463100.1 hypothetical protein [Xylella taiwanensis]MCD8465349.1 hypothetical protein [Xylella taiwanensis]